MYPKCGEIASLRRPRLCLELDDVRPQRGRDRVQPLRHGRGPLRAHVAHRGEKRGHSQLVLCLRHQQGGD